MILSDGKEIKECDVWEKDDGVVVVTIGNKTFEFDLPDEEIIKLVGGNPYHDKKGRFAPSPEGLVKAGKIVGAVGAVASLSGTVLQGYVGTKVHEKVKEMGGEEITLKDFFSSTGKKKIEKNQGLVKGAEEIVFNQKAFSRKIGGKEVTVTYGELNRAGKELRSIGAKAQLVAGLLFVGAVAAVFHEAGNPDAARNRAYREWHQRERQRSKETPRAQQWPKKATDEDFKNMYRKVAKRYHPDLGGSTEQMQKINQAYANKDWFTIEDLYKKLELYLEENEFTQEQAEMLGMLIKILKQALDDDADYVIFPTEEDQDYEPFVVEDGEMILDRPTIQLIVEAFLGSEDEGTDRPESSKE